MGVQFTRVDPKCAVAYANKGEHPTQRRPSAAASGPGGGHLPARYQDMIAQSEKLAQRGEIKRAIEPLHNVKTTLPSAN